MGSYGELVIMAVQARGKEGASRVRISNWINAQHEGLNKKLITKAVSKAIADKKIEASKRKPGIFKVVLLPKSPLPRKRRLSKRPRSQLLSRQRRPLLRSRPRKPLRNRPRKQPRRRLLRSKRMISDV